MGEYSEVRSRRWAVGRGSLLTWSPLTRLYSSVARGSLLAISNLSQYIFETEFVFRKAKILSTLSHCVLLIALVRKENTRDDNNRIKLE